MFSLTELQKDFVPHNLFHDLPPEIRNKIYGMVLDEAVEDKKKTAAVLKKHIANARQALEATLAALETDDAMGGVHEVNVMRFGNLSFSVQIL